MTRRPLSPPPFNGPRFNEFIQSARVRVIDGEGENLGVMLTAEAIEAAAAEGLDLVEISPNADPPVCKILDVGKFKYEAQKKAAAARKNQKTQEIKEIKMRPNIDDHDYNTKMKKLGEFIDEGDKVKVKFLGQDDRGKIRLSMKVVDQETGEDITEKVKAQRDTDRAERGDEPREPREGGRHRGERRREEARLVATVLAPVERRGQFLGQTIFRAALGDRKPQPLHEGRVRFSRREQDRSQPPAPRR